MTALTRRTSWPTLPDIAAWLEGGLFGHQPIHLEEYDESGVHVVRADLPGLRSADDVHVHLAGDRLTIQAERQEEARQKYRSEIRYGQFVRTLTLPPGADKDKVRASYRNGVLEIRVPVIEPQEGQRIPVAHENGG
ncbi:HSP20 family molecular chaperone IbpA [Crossiella equi]|uniref:HSP20 family molecular chaperone IbpA n=1 Tax=Crossiella equi TaxID=130796 RepID=A0ABS5ASH2_9PSEU|nr:Hsp20/alpha crystallin family protein [Crossiella equi]MBP2479520.1 HSP20 family molecular chaperone IbpA [Crossiella equi]